MTDATFYVLYGAMSVFFLAIARGARRAWSGESLTDAKYRTAVTYNLVVGAFHVNFVKNGDFLFFGGRDNDLLVWFSLAFGVAHILSLPSDRKKTRRFWRERPDSVIRYHVAVHRRTTSADILFYYLKIVIMLAVTSILFTGVFALALVWLVELFMPLKDPYQIAILGVTFLAVFPFICWTIHLHHKKHGRTL